MSSIFDPFRYTVVAVGHQLTDLEVLVEDIVAQAADTVVQAVGTVVQAVGTVDRREPVGLLMTVLK